MRDASCLSQAGSRGMTHAVLALGAALALLVAACAPAAQPAVAPPAPAKPAAGAPGASQPAPAAGAQPAAPAAPQALQPVNLGFSVLGVSNAALLTAAEGGLYQRNGLDVELSALGAGQTSLAALLSGEVPAVSTSPVSAFNAVLAGGEVVIVGAVFDTISYQIISTPDIRSVDELRGKTFGINRLEGGPH